MNIIDVLVKAYGDMTVFEGVVKLRDPFHYLR